MKNLKLKDILPYLDKIDTVILCEYGVKLSDYWDYDEVFEGSVMDIPWIYMEDYLINSSEGEAIAVRKRDDDKAVMYISIAETRDEPSGSLSQHKKKGCIN